MLGRLERLLHIPGLCLDKAYFKPNWVPVRLNALSSSPAQ